MSSDRDFLQRFSGEDRMTAAQIADKLQQCARRNLLTHTMFLNPHEQAIAREVISCCGHPAHILKGGYEEAERRVVLFLPDYLSAELLTAEDLPFGIVRAAWGKSAKLTHRDILGSLMAQGIRREVLGDILVREDGCDLFVLRDCMRFLLDNWSSAGRYGISPVEIAPEALKLPQDDGVEVQDTVATLRTDAVLGSGFSLSRGKASALIAAGRVSLNGCECQKPDKLLQAGDILSVRGQGRLILQEVGGLSKKGRLRILMRRFG